MKHLFICRGKFWSEWIEYRGSISDADVANYTTYKHIVRMQTRNCTNCGRKEMRHA